MASITLNAVQKSYGGGAPVIRNVDLEIGEHEFCVFLGPSGCGKSTLLRMIAGLEDLSGGELCIGGERMNDVAPAERGVAMVFQSYALFPHMSVYDNIGFGLKLAKTPKDELDRRVREAARVLQLEELLERKPKQLSGGQRQRWRAALRQRARRQVRAVAQRLDGGQHARARFLADLAALAQDVGNGGGGDASVLGDLR